MLREGFIRSTSDPEARAVHAGEKVLISALLGLLQKSHRTF